MSRDAEGKCTIICYDWMLEFLCYDMWRKFCTESELNQGLEHLIDGILSSQRDRSSAMIQSKQVAFLSLISYLMTLRRNGIDSGLSSSSLEQSEFSLVLGLVDDLSFFCHSDDVADLVSRVAQKTLLQRLYAYCRQDQYDLAQELFEEECDQLDRETTCKVQAILHSKTPHRYLQEDTLTDYLATITQYLEAVYQTFPARPAMMMLAKHYTKKETRYKGASTSYTHREIMECGDESDSGSQETLEGKLQRIRKQKRKAMALKLMEVSNSRSVSNPDSGSDSEGDNDAEQSDRPRKRVERNAGVPQKTAGPRPQTRNAGVPQKTAGPRPQTSPTKRADADPNVSVDNSSSSDLDLSLQSRVPFKKQQFHLRASLAPQLKCRKPPSHAKQSVGRVRWSEREEEEFYQAVQEHGVGQWARIRTALKTSRTSVQLKDKWRNICNTVYQQLCKKFGPVK